MRLPLFGQDVKILLLKKETSLRAARIFRVAKQSTGLLRRLTVASQ